MKALITGCAGFIGFHLTSRLLANGWKVTGIDNFDSFYNVRIKEGNVEKLKRNDNFRFLRLDINELETLRERKSDMPDLIIHLAAKAGVRPSFDRPLEYIRTNIDGTVKVLEFARKNKITKLVFASSSSIYGSSKNTPFKEDDPQIRPMSPYGMTKYHGEAFCGLYSELYDLNINALRFFSVYGPLQRPDMAINKFIMSILDGKPIRMFGKGEMFRDYTFIDDIVNGIENSLKFFDGFNVFNLGRGKPIPLIDMITTIGDILDIEPVIEQTTIPPGEMEGTFADISKARRFLKYDPRTEFDDGVRLEVEWVRKNKDLIIDNIPNKAYI